MALRIRSIGPDATPSTQLSLETLARVLRSAILAEVIDRCAAREKRARKLPASTVLLLC
jgi:Insertion element 4 transposase N-terminal